MNEKPIDQMNNDELALHIAKLESQPLVAALQDLQPQSSARDLFELGFAAGEQAQAARVQLPDHRDFVSRWAWAAISSAVSVAATVMIMIPMAPMLERSSSRHIAEAEQPKRELLQPKANPRWCATSLANPQRLISKVLWRNWSVDQASRGRPHRLAWWTPSPRLCANRCAMSLSAEHGFPNCRPNCNKRFLSHQVL